MRDLRRYLTRRKVVDVQSWLRSSGLSTIDELASFCEANNLRFASEEYVGFFVIELAPPVSKVGSQPTSKAEVEEEAPEVKSKAWHIPAAKRPLAKQKQDTSKKVTKPRGSSTNKD